jgi:hypothetical protein
MVNVQTLFEAFLNMFQRCISAATGLKEFYCSKMNKVFFF